MSKPRAYVEPTIPSFLLEERQEPEIVARRRWTESWWTEAAARYELVTSVAVLEELLRAPAERGAQRAALLDGLPLLPVTPAVAEVAAVYVARKVMPGDLSGDALHLALASWHRCDFLVTWNCRHLANANKFAHIRRVNVMLGLQVPILATPLQLLGGSEND